MSKKKVSVTAEVPEEIAALFCANNISDAQQLANIKMDIHFNFLPPVESPSPSKDEDMQRIAKLEQMLDTMVDEHYTPDKKMPEKRMKSMVVLLCLNLFMHTWQLEGRTLSQYQKVNKSALARLIAYLTGIKLKYISELIPSDSSSCRTLVPSPQQKEDLESLLRGLLDVEIKDSDAFLTE